MIFRKFKTNALRTQRKHRFRLTRTRLSACVLTITAVFIALAGLNEGPAEGATPYSEILELDMPVRPIAAITDDRIGTGGSVSSRSAGTGTGTGSPLSGTDHWQTVIVRPGQTLDAIFRQQGLSVSLLHNILSINSETKGLKKIRPGDTFDFRRDEEGGLNQMRYALNESSYLLVRNEGGTLTAEKQMREILTEVHESSGVITSSLFLAGKQAGMSDAMIMKLANIFGWDIDFVLDIREGDRFYVVFEKLYREGEFLRYGEILAATFVNQGERFQAVRFADGDNYSYFAPDGKNMRKAFLRAPLNFSYISSGFNPRRMHPVLKRIRPHNGIDYYAPRGTPVYAAGGGKVIRSAYSKTNGHHVFIEHEGSIVTKYLHFTNRAVKQGQKVKQGQTIGYVGSTGLATGPHLHYEFVVNNVHRNPRTVPLPKVESLQGKQLAAFQTHAASYLTHLSRLESGSLYASRE
jgi:murein DD-endopeptidase MepM/ murein hydrolase activator NlpD